MSACANEERHHWSFWFTGCLQMDSKWREISWRGAGRGEGWGLLWRRKERPMMKDRSEGGNVVGMRTIWVRITADGLLLRKSEIWKSGTFVNIDFISQKTLTGVGSFLESLSLKSAVYRPEWNSVPHLDLHLSPSLAVYVSLWGSNQSPPSINHFNRVSYLTGLLLSWLW